MPMILHTDHLKGELCQVDAVRSTIRVPSWWDGPPLTSDFSTMQACNCFWALARNQHQFKSAFPCVISWAICNGLPNSFYLEFGEDTMCHS